MWLLGGHLGTSVGALVDGQLERAAAERAWSHVLGCRSCRDLVEQEGRTKTEVATLAGAEPSAQLLGSLYSLKHDVTISAPSSEGLQAWVAVDEIERRGGRRRMGLAIVGAGSAAAVFGFASLSGAALSIGGPTASTPTASLSRPSPPSPSTALIAPIAHTHGRLPTSFMSTAAVLTHER